MLTESERASGRSERRLAAIMFTDIVGYTALMAESEQRGRRVRERHVAIVRPLVERYHGRWIEQTGDESLSSFASAVDAVNCALAIQQALGDDEELRIRIGVHQADVAFEEGRVIGDGVNIAARIRPLAEPGGVAISDEVQHAVQNRENVQTRTLGEHDLKHVPRPVEVFAVSGTAEPPQRVSGAARQARPRALPLAAWGAATVGVVAIVLWWWLPRSSPDLDPIRSIVVLPLENLSGDSGQDYFTDGMTEALIANLAQIGSLRVISRTSAMHYKGSRKLLPEIARELDVDAVIEGSVLRAGSGLRITAQLIDARDDRHLWAHSYERDLRDILALQSEVSQAIVRAIQVELTPLERTRLARAHPVDPAAHEAYLRGRHFVHRHRLDATLKAARYFEQATRVDPDYALAWAGLAEAYS